MRRQTQWALGGVLAGTVLLGTTGTLAVFTDTETVGVTVGAASLQMYVAPQPGPGRHVQLNARTEQSVPLEIGVTGGGGGVLSVSLDGEPADCTDLSATALTVTVAGVDTTVPLCALVTSPLALAELTADAPEVDLILRVGRDPAGPTRQVARPWMGDLRFTVDRSGGGFSDTGTIAVQVLPPSPSRAGGAVSTGRDDVEPDGPSEDSGPAPAGDEAGSGDPRGGRENGGDQPA